MSATRRDFMKSLGISIGSVVLAGCAPTSHRGDQKVILEVSKQSSTFSTSFPTEVGSLSPSTTPSPKITQNTPIQIEELVTKSPTLQEKFPFNDPELSPRARLRYCWFYLSWLARCYGQDPAKGEWARDLLITSHRAALIELIIAGKMSEAIARDVQKGFDSAVNHVHTITVPVMCYD